MSRANGGNSILVAGFEDTYNAVPASPKGVSMPFISSNLKASQNMTASKVIRGDRNPTPPILGNKNVSGTIVVPVDVTGIGYWLKAAFGAPKTTNTGESGPYTHKFTIGQTMPSLFIDQGYKDINVYEQFTGVRISKLSMDFGGDGELTASLDVMGCKENLQDSPTVSNPTEIQITEFGNFQASVQEGGKDIAICTAIDVEVDFGLDGDSYPIGAKGYRTDIDPGLVSVSGNLTAMFTDKALLEKAVNNTESSIVIRIVNGQNQLIFSIPEVQYSLTSPGIDGPSGIDVKLPFQGYYTDNTDKSAFIATLINNQATY